MPEAFDHRVQTARLLIESTDLPFADIAFAAEFTGVGEFDAVVRQVCGTPPSLLRDRRSTRPTRHNTGPATLSLRLPVRLPFSYAGVFGHLAVCAAPGCEEVRDGTYRRTLRLPHGSGVIGLKPRADHVRSTFTLDDLRDLPTAILQCRRLLDLDLDPQPVIETLAADQHLGPAVLEAPGQRIPGTVDAAELAVRAVLSQQVSLKAAATHTGRLVSAYGDPITDPDGALTHTFPAVERLTEIDPAELAMPRSRRRTLTALVAALAEGDIVLAHGCDRQRARAQLLALPGIGPWTAEIIAMRGLGDPDAFPVSDLGVKVAAKQLGLPDGVRALSERSARWRPWRSYATQQLWATLDHGVNDWPPKEAA